MTVQLLMHNASIGNKAIRKASTAVRDGAVNTRNKISMLRSQPKHRGYLFDSKFKGLVKKTDFHSATINTGYKKNGEMRVHIPKHKELTSKFNKLGKAVKGSLTTFANPTAYKEGLERHSLSGWKEAMKQFRYKLLTKKRKAVVDWGMQLHDLGKIGKAAKTEHAKDSAIQAKEVLSRTKMPQKLQELTLKLIEHHHYTEEMAKAKKKGKEADVFKKYMEAFPSKRDFKLLEIMSTADLRSKKDTAKVKPRLIENKEFFKAQRAEYNKRPIKKQLKDDYNIDVDKILEKYTPSFLKKKKETQKV